MNIRLLLAFLSLSFLGYCQTSSTLIPFKVGTKWGYSDTARNMVIPAIYDTVYFFKSNMARVRKGKKEGIIGITNNVIIPLVYATCEQLVFTEIVADRVEIRTHFSVSKAGKFGVVDAKNKVKIPLDYDEIRWETERNSIVRKGKLYGAFKNESGNYQLIIPLKYNDMNYYWLQGFYECATNNTFEIRDEDGSLIPDAPPFESDNSMSGEGFDESYPRFQYKLFTENGKFGLNEKIGKNEIQQVLSPIYDSIIILLPTTNSILNGFFFVAKKNGKWGVVSKSEMEMVPFVYDAIDANTAIYESSKNYPLQFFVRQNDLWGMIGRTEFIKDARNVLLIPITFSAYEHVDEEHLLVTRNGLYGLYDRVNARFITEIIYTSFNSRSSYIARDLLVFWVSDSQGRKFLIDNKGRTYFSEK